MLRRACARATGREPHARRDKILARLIKNRRHHEHRVVRRLRMVGPYTVAPAGPSPSYHRVLRQRRRRAHLRGLVAARGPIARVALSVAAGVAYYLAKQDIDARRRDQAVRNSRSLERKSWQDQVYEYETTGPGAKAFQASKPPSAEAANGGKST